MNHLKQFAEFKKSRAAAKQSPEMVKEKQEEAVRRLLAYAYDHSDFYREKYKKAGIRRSEIDRLPLTAFPPTDREEIIRNFPRVLTHDPMDQQELIDFEKSGIQGSFRNKWHLVHSSGSTGDPCYFVYDNEAWRRLLVSGTRSFFWGMSLGEILAFITGKVRILYVAVTGERFGGAAMVSAAGNLLHAEIMTLDVSEPFENWKRKVEDFKPVMIIGYPSALTIITEEMEKTGIRLPVKRIITCAETLSPRQRSYLEAYYRTTVVNFYAATESLTLGVETDAETGMILLDDMNYIEVNDRGMYLTNLYNYGQPLIRYHISDSIEKLPPKPEKSGFSRCRVKLGRAEDIMWFSDGNGRSDFIHPTLLEDFCLPDLIRYQFIQQSQDSFRVNLEVAVGGNPLVTSEKLRKMIRKTLDTHHLEFVTFKTRVVDHIMPNPKTGKCRLCIALPRERADKPGKN